MFSTRFTTTFGVAHPLVQAGMGNGAGWELAAAVSNAGALGTVGTIGRLPVDVREQLQRCREATDRPFSVNVATFDWAPFAEEVVDAVLAARPHSVTLSFGDPLPALERCKAAGVRAIVQVQDWRGAQEAIAARPDAIIVQGAEAGGHSGRRGTLNFAAQVLDASGDIPVLIAGGVGSGRGLAAALGMGASGVVMGTAFKATPEFRGEDWQKQAIVASDGSNAVQDEVFDLVDGGLWPHGVLGRAFAGRLTDEWSGRGEELLKIIESDGYQAFAARYSNPAEIERNWAGESSGLVAGVAPATDVVRKTVATAEALLRNVAAALA
jgi:nitronate monooxygenase